MKIDVIIPGSPTDAFYAQMAFFRKSLDNLGDLYKSARLLCVFGDEEIKALPSRWVPFFENIDVIWADPEEFRQENVYAQGLLRFDVAAPDADLAILCDADTVFIRPIPELLDQAVANPAIRGCITHAPPTYIRTPEDWLFVYQRLINKEPNLEFRHTLIHPDLGNNHISRPCPFYINNGVIFGPPDMLRQLGQRMRSLRHAYLQLHDDIFFCGQISNALAIHDLGLPHEEIPMRYNYPNDPHADQLYPDEMNHMAICHYLRKTVFDRWEIFTHKEAFENFMSLKLEGSNLVFQNRVKEITSGVYPFV